MSRWQDKAICVGADLYLFYPYDSDAKAIAEAKRICSNCPVQAECLQEGQDLRDFQGIRGGFTGEERRVLDRRERRRKPPGAYKRVVSPVPLHGPGEGSLSLYRKGCPCAECREHNHQKGVRAREQARERVSA